MQRPSIPRSIGIKRRPLLAVLAACLLVALTRASAATHYVDAASTNAVPPFASWATAAVTIQDAVDAAVAGDEIVVTNGVYQTGARAVYGMSNRVAVTKPVTVRSVNGPEVTVIRGAGPIGDTAIRCVYLTNGAVLAGFTLTNGATRIDGDDPQAATVSNSGGGVWCQTRDAVVINCVIVGNSAWGPGGGAHGNTLNDCTLTGNSTSWGGGAAGSTLNNCVLMDNFGGDTGGGAVFSTLNNCTLTGNTGRGGAAFSMLSNCIAYYNEGGNHYQSTLNYSCTTPAPESGVGNITNAPLFVDTNGWSNLRLQSSSPCINAGNNAYVAGNTDLDGHPRIVGGAVDIGAFEWQGTIRYVSAASTNPIAPYSSWATAAVTIQDAVDAAVAGDEIVVTNGVYQTGARAVYGMSNRVAVTKAVTVRSVNGPTNTIIQGAGPVGDNAIRCAYLTNGAVLAGFTLTNGATQFNGDSETDSITNSGGGVWCESQSVVITNCVLAGNTASSEGGGAYSGTLHNCIVTRNYAWYAGGGAAQSTLHNCTLPNNSASIFGGAAIGSALVHCTLTGNGAEIGGGGAYSSRLTNCTVMSNSVSYIVTAFNYGGGVASSTLENCLVMDNSAWDENGVGGGAHASTLNNCTLRGNLAHGGAGAILSTLNNCLVVENLAASDGCGGGAALSALTNCTLTGNSASYGGGCCASTVNNCIVYDNTARASGDNYTTGTFNYSCTTPAPGSGVGNITNTPLFVDTNGWSNLRCQSNSPCINAGNNAYVTTATDLDGLPRIAGGTVDIGAYEFQSPASTISYAWLQQSGLPIDGSTDRADTDHDAHDNWQEWMAGTDPTNALSALRLAAPLITPTNVILTWTSVSNRTYTLEQSTNLGGAPAFSVLRSNLAGLPGTTSWTDTNAPVSSSRFYRLRVSR